MKAQQEIKVIPIDQQIAAGIKDIKASKRPLNTKQQKLLRDAEHFPCEKNLAFLADLYQSLQEQVHLAADPIIYTGSMSWNDFNPDHLIKINNAQTKQDVYLYFDPDYILGFENLSDVDQEKFQRLAKPENLKISRAENDQGIKILPGNNGLPKCRLSIKNQEYTFPFSRELKIQGSPERIGVICLEPLKSGPVILLATRCIEGGFHTKEHKGKIFSAQKLEPHVPKRSMPTIEKISGYGKNKSAFFMPAKEAGCTPEKFDQLDAKTVAGLS